jgi:hypothetical protein
VAPIDAVTVAVAPAASVPPADDKVTHVCVFAAVQVIDVPPVFVSVYDALDGVNGPPTVPEDVRLPADNDNAPGVMTIGTTQENAGESADSSPVFRTAFAVK